MSDDDQKWNSEAIRAFYILQPDYIDASLDGAVATAFTAYRLSAEDWQ
jgi:hypothetical protein